MTTPKSYLTHIYLGFKLRLLRHRQAKALHVGSVLKHMLLFSLAPEWISRLFFLSLQTGHLCPPRHCPLCPVLSPQTAPYGA